jgi:hypothetical protein
MKNLKKTANGFEDFDSIQAVFDKLHGPVNPRKIGDYGIDGCMEPNAPLQVKQSESVGSNVVDN